MSGEAAGKDYLLQVETSPGSNSYSTIGGLRSKGFVLQHEGIEVTNHGSSQKKEYLDAAGISSAKLQGSGVFNRDAQTHALIRANVWSGNLTKFRIIDQGSGGETATASWHIDSYEKTGEYKGAIEFNLSLSSHGDITWS
jgi:predicted secreted protein